MWSFKHFSFYTVYVAAIILKNALNVTATNIATIVRVGTHIVAPIRLVTTLTSTTILVWLLTPPIRTFWNDATELLCCYQG